MAKRINGINSKISKLTEVDYQEAKYIIDYFPRLMSQEERRALNHFMLSNKLGTKDKYSSLKQFQSRKKFFKEKLGYEENAELLKRFEHGYEHFAIQTAKRIKKDTPKDFRLNDCPKCGFLTRTPYAKQCRKCCHNWHDEIAAEFELDMVMCITGKPYLWIVGNLLKGEIQIGDRIDLTNFQINLIAEIKQIEFGLKSINGIKKELPSLGIEVNDSEKELIKKYLKKSAKSIMILNKKYNQEKE